MSSATTEEIKINSYSKELLQKIQYLYPRLNLNDQLTNLAQQLASLIRKREVTSPATAEAWIKEQKFVPNNLKKIVAVYDANNVINPFEYCLAKTDFNKITQDPLMNCIGISVRPLKSKKIILVVLFAEQDEKATDKKVKSIIEEFNGKVPNWDPGNKNKSIDLLYQLINSFRANFSLPQVDVKNELSHKEEPNDKSEFKEIGISIQKDKDILLSSLNNPSFTELIFSPIESVAAKVEDDNTNELKIIFQAKRILKHKNEKPINKTINASSKQNLDADATNEKQSIENLAKHSSTEKPQVKEPEESKAQQADGKEELIESEITQTKEPPVHPLSEEKKQQTNEFRNQSDKKDDQSTEDNIRQPETNNLTEIQHTDSEINHPQPPTEEQINTETEVRNEVALPDSHQTEIQPESNLQEEIKQNDIKEPTEKDEATTTKNDEDESIEYPSKPTDVNQNENPEDQNQTIEDDELADEESESQNQSDKKDDQATENTIEQPENDKEIEKQETDIKDNLTDIQQTESEISHPQPPTEEQNKEPEQTKIETKNEVEIPDSHPASEIQPEPHPQDEIKYDVNKEEPTTKDEPTEKDDTTATTTVTKNDEDESIENPQKAADKNQTEQQEAETHQFPADEQNIESGIKDEQHNESITDQSPTIQQETKPENKDDFENTQRTEIEIQQSSTTEKEPKTENKDDFENIQRTEIEIQQSSTTEKEPEPESKDNFENIQQTEIQQHPPTEEEPEIKIQQPSATEKEPETENKDDQQNESFEIQPPTAQKEQDANPENKDNEKLESATVNQPPSAEPENNDNLENAQQTDTEIQQPSATEPESKPENKDYHQNELFVNQPPTIQQEQGEEPENKDTQSESTTINHPPSVEPENKDDLENSQQTDTEIQQPATTEPKPENKDVLENSHQTDTEIQQPATTEPEPENKDDLENVQQTDTEIQHPAIIEPEPESKDDLENAQQTDTEIQQSTTEQDTESKDNNNLSEEQESSIHQPEPTTEQKTESENQNDKQNESFVNQPPATQQEQDIKPENKDDEQSESTTVNQQPSAEPENKDVLENSQQTDTEIQHPSATEPEQNPENKDDIENSQQTDTEIQQSTATEPESKPENKDDHQNESFVNQPPTAQQEQDIKPENKDNEQPEPTTVNHPPSSEPSNKDDLENSQQTDTEIQHPATTEQNPENNDVHQSSTIEHEQETENNKSAENKPQTTEHDTEDKESNLSERSQQISQPESNDESTEATEKHIILNKDPKITTMPRQPSEVLLIDSPKSILTTPKKTRSPRSSFIDDDDDLVSTSPPNSVKLNPAKNNQKEINSATENISQPITKTESSNEKENISQPITKTESSNEKENENISQPITNIKTDNENDNENKSIVDTKTDNENNNNNDDDELDSLPKPVDLDSPCFDPSDLTTRAIMVYNSEYNVLSNDPPIKEMCDKLQDFMNEHKNDFNKSDTRSNARDLFDKDITDYKKAFTFCAKTWKEIRAEIGKNAKRDLRKASKEQVIFAIASIIQQEGSSPQSDAKFNLCYVTRSTGLSASNSTSSQADLFLTPNPKATQSQNVGETPLKKTASESLKNFAQTPDPTKRNVQQTVSIPSRYVEQSERLEYEVFDFLRNNTRNNTIQVNTEISARVRQELQNNRGKKWDNIEIKEMIENDIDYPWARFYCNKGYDEMIKKVKTEYKNLFAKRLALAKVLIIAAISEDPSTNTFSLAVATGQIKTNTNNTNNNTNNTNNTNASGVPNLNLKDSKGSATASNTSFNSSGTQSANQSGSATPRTGGKRRRPKVINDFERSHFYLDAFNTYRKSLNRGLPDLELNDALIDPAKDLSRTIMQSFSMVNFKPYLEAANKNPKVENVKACAAFDSKTNDYVSRTFDQMVAQYKDAVESDNDKMAIGYWNDKDQNVSVACFLFRFKKQ